MQTPDGESGGGWSGEDELLVDDEVFPEGDDESNTEVCDSDGQGEEFPNIVSRVEGKEVEAVHGRDTGDEENTYAKPRTRLAR